MGPWAVLQQESCSERQIGAHENEESLSPVNIFGLRQSCTKVSLCCLLGGAEASSDKLKLLAGKREHLLPLLLASITQIKSYENQHHAEDIRYQMKPA